MVNKEFIIGGGAIVKDFSDRNISQYSNNVVCVSVLIPTSEFVGKENYSVEMAISKKVGGITTTLPSLICSSAKTLKYEGIDYIKWQCILSISYTNFIGQLYLTPYIVESAEVDGDIVITKQSTFTTATLNVIKAIDSTSDASLEEAEVVDTIMALLNGKKIKFIEDYKNGTEAQAIAGCFTDYNASFYSGWLLVVKYNGGQCILLPYLNGDDPEFTKITMDGLFYKESDFDNGTYTETQLTYTKSEIDTLLTNYYTKSETYSKSEVDDDFVKKTRTINGHALTSDVVVSKGDVGLGNVENYGIVNSPSADATNKYVDASGLYTYLLTNYASLSDYNETKGKVEQLEAILKLEPDENSVVDTLYDLIQVFQNFPESQNVASILSDIEARLTLVEQLQNSVLTIDGVITLDADDWVANTGDYSSDYPYKITYQNNQLIDVSNFNVIFSVDADTSLLSRTCELNETTGTITFYASDVVESNIDIEKIVCITSLNSVITYNATTEAQVQQNKNDIIDIKNDYVKKETNSTLLGYNYEQIIGRVAGGISLTVSRTNSEDETDSEYGTSDITYGSSLIGYRKHPNRNDEKFNRLRISKDGLEYKSTIKVGGVATSHTFTIDNNGVVKTDDKTIPTERLFKTTTDATESGGIYTLDVSGITGIEETDYLLYVNSGTAEKLYQVASITSSTATLTLIASFGGGGGKQLYQHNIFMQNSNDKKLTCQATVINDSNISFDYSTFKIWLNDKGFKYDGNNHHWFNASGHWSNGQILGIDFVSSQNAIFGLMLNDSSTTQTEGEISSSYLTFTDTVLTL